MIGPHADCARKFFGGYTHLCMMESVYAVANSIAGVESSEESGSLDAEVEKRVPGTQTVSYAHLDVYKRQGKRSAVLW